MNERKPTCVSVISIHEAGHAVVAAHLRIPFHRVTIQPGKMSGSKPGEESGGHVRLGKGHFAIGMFCWDRRRRTFRLRSQQEIRQELRSKVSNWSIMLLAARAAVECFPEWHNRDLESSYRDDEEHLLNLAKVVDISGRQFPAWRNKLLEKAREIVAIPEIQHCIRYVAIRLEQEYERSKKSVSAKEVRELLR